MLLIGLFVFLAILVVLGVKVNTPPGSLDKLDNRRENFDYENLPEI